MNRTQIYLTDEQRRRLDQRASDAGVPMAEVVRRILDEALDITTSRKARMRAVEESFGVLDDGETTDEFLARVRTPGGANARLRKLGLSD
jgi:hypothetical protein